MCRRQPNSVVRPRAQAKENDFDRPKFRFYELDDLVEVPGNRQLEFHIRLSQAVPKAAEVNPQ
jgi:hypothetical protein